MTTLMTQTTSGGRTRRCTARCYNAKKPSCRCICDSLNHGVGLVRAQENMAKMGEALPVALPD